MRCPISQWDPCYAMESGDPESPVVDRSLKTKNSIFPEGSHFYLECSSGLGENHWQWVQCSELLYSIRGTLQNCSANLPSGARDSPVNLSEILLPHYICLGCTFVWLLFSSLSLPWTLPGRWSNRMSKELLDKQLHFRSFCEVIK